MSILQLPPEIVIQIFNHVGSSYFRSNLSRLTVCKQWSRFAYTACFRDFYVTQKTLRFLLSSPYAETNLSLIKDSMEILDLRLEGFEDWESIPLWRQESLTTSVLDVRAWDYDHGRGLRMAWTTELNTNLSNIAAIIKQSQKLRTLCIRTASEQHPLFPYLERRDYLYQSTIRALLSASNLTSLDLDLCGTRLIPPQQTQEHGEEIHICTTIAALLTIVRCLRLRMRSLCPDVLNPRQHSVKLRLNKVLINLSLSKESPLITSAAHALRCGSSRACVLQLEADMQKQAQLLVAQMAAPKTVRILAHALPSLEMRAFDVLTGRNVTLIEGADWDDDGETIESKVSDEESEISSLSSDDDE